MAIAVAVLMDTPDLSLVILLFAIVVAVKLLLLVALTVVGVIGVAKMCEYVQDMQYSTYDINSYITYCFLILMQYITKIYRTHIYSLLSFEDHMYVLCTQNSVLQTRVQSCFFQSPVETEKSHKEMLKNSVKNNLK